MWRSGSASPCQGEGREFESRHPLEFSLIARSAAHGGQPDVLRFGRHGGLAERRGSGLQSRIHGFESRIHLQPEAHRQQAWAIGAAVARFPDTEEVTGSIPVSPTTRKPPLNGAFFVSTASNRSTAESLGEYDHRVCGDNPSGVVWSAGARVNGCRGGLPLRPWSLLFC